VLPSLREQIDLSLVWLHRQGDDLIPLHLSLVGTICLFLDSVDDLKGCTLPVAGPFRQREQQLCLAQYSRFP
jgi:hypothetical protein